jgi:DNA-directed RNA polymerase subunit RPC12/RpoP
MSKLECFSCQQSVEPSSSKPARCPQCGSLLLVAPGPVRYVDNLFQRRQRTFKRAQPIRRIPPDGSFPPAA